MSTPEAQAHRAGAPLMRGHFVNTDAEEGLSDHMYQAATVLLAAQCAKT